MHDLSPRKAAVVRAGEPDPRFADLGSVHAGVVVHTDATDVGIEGGDGDVRLVLLLAVDVPIVERRVAVELRRTYRVDVFADGELRRLGRLSLDAGDPEKKG
jgi:hypothetical protein